MGFSISSTSVFFGSILFLTMLGLAKSFFLSKGLLKGAEMAMKSSGVMKMSSGSIKSLVSIDFQKILKGPERKSYQIVDVREPQELELAKIPGDDVINLPLSQAGSWSGEIMQGKLLDQDKPTICVCHHGVRSYRMAHFLASQAQFEDVYNLEGGIHAYATEADTSIGTY